MYIMIMQQENDSETPNINDEKPLPKYTLERMILAYFTEQF